MEVMMGTSVGLLKYVQLENVLATVPEFPYCYISLGFERRAQY